MLATCQILFGSDSSLGDSELTVLDTLCYRDAPSLLTNDLSDSTGSYDGLSSCSETSTLSGGDLIGQEGILSFRDTSTLSDVEPDTTLYLGAP